MHYCLCGAVSPELLVHVLDKGLIIRAFTYNQQSCSAGLAVLSPLRALPCHRVLQLRGGAEGPGHVFRVQVVISAKARHIIQAPGFTVLVAFFDQIYLMFLQ